MWTWNERQNGQRQNQGRKRFPTCHEYEQRRQQIELRLRRQGPEVGGLERVSASRCRTKSPMDVRHQPGSGDQVLAGDTRLPLMLAAIAIATSVAQAGTAMRKKRRA